VCLIIAKVKNRVLGRDILEAAFEKNNDGCGFAYADKGKLILKKPFFDFGRFWKAFNKIQKGRAAIVHFRIATIGNRSEENVHPFQINENVCMAHNGTLVDWTPDDESKSTKSDSRWFNEAVLIPLLKAFPNAYTNSTIQYLLEKEISTNNRMALLDSKGRIVILRKQTGEIIDRCWFSNDNYKEIFEKKKNETKQKTFKYPKESPQAQTIRQQIEGILGGKSRLGEINISEGSLDEKPNFLCTAEELLQKRFKKTEMTLHKFKSGSTKGAPSTRFTEFNEYGKALTQGRGKNAKFMIDVANCCPEEFRDMFK
jgi:predicted glutamine amidotransferase